MSAQKILVASAQRHRCSIHQMVLSDAGYEVITALTQQDAFTLLQENTFDLAIADYDPKGVNGIELLDEIRKRSNSVPVIITTLYPSVELAKKALRQGAFDLI